MAVCDHYIGLDTQAELFRMNKKFIGRILSFCVAGVWLVNGLFCKLLNFIPRHELIVAKILGDQNAALATKLIGAAEILMAIWVVSNLKPRICTPVQVVIIITMNLLEFFLAPELLLFGKANIIFAFLFCCLIFLGNLNAAAPPPRPYRKPTLP